MSDGVKAKREERKNFLGKRKERKKVLKERGRRGKECRCKEGI